MNESTIDCMDHQLLVYGRGHLWGVVVYYATDCSRVSNQNPIGKLDWIAWSLDSKRQELSCSIPTAQSVGRADDGSILIGGEVVTQDADDWIRGCAENRVQVGVSPNLELDRLPLFVSPVRDAEPAIYRVIAKMHVTSLGELPDVRAAVQFEKFIWSVLSARRIGTDQTMVSSNMPKNASGLYEGARLPVEVEDGNRVIPAVLELSQFLADDNWSARLYLLRSTEKVGIGSTLTRTVSLSLDRECRRFNAQIGTIVTISSDAL